VFPLKLNQPLFNLFLGEGLVALGALVEFVNDLVIDELIRKIDSMEKERKVVDQLKILVLTLVADKKILDRIHSTTPHNTYSLLIFPTRLTGTRGPATSIQFSEPQAAIILHDLWISPWLPECCEP